MLSSGWRTIELQAEERPVVLPEDLRAIAEELDPDDYDEPVQEFLEEIAKGNNVEDLRQVATLLLQDEVDFSPDLRKVGVEPDEKLIALLLTAGADVNARNPYGELPLHLASRYGYTEIAKMLLAAGAKRDLRNARGELAIALAANRELIDLLAPQVENEGEQEEHECHCGHHHEADHECCCGHDHNGEHTCHCNEKNGHRSHNREH